MNKTISFVRLDLRTIKPYVTIKNFIIFAAIAVLLLFSNKSSNMPISILMAYATLYVSYPFAVGDKTQIDALYATLAIQRKTVVLGRYLFAFFITFITGFAAYLLTGLLSLFSNIPFYPYETLLFTLILFVLFTLVQAFQLPIFFKLGYMKAKFLSYAPMLLFLLLTVLLRFVLEELDNAIEITYWLERNKTILIAAIPFVLIGAVCLSFYFSKRVYDKREF